jgi:hypothetical protein
VIALLRRIQLIALLTLVAGCGAGDVVGPTGFAARTLPDGSVIAEPALETNPGIVGLLGSVEAGTLNLASILNASPSTTTSANATDLKAAILTIFADPSSGGTGSSGGGSGSLFGTHAFITIKNNSTSSITIGRLSGIAPGKTVSVGTWGNTAEHKGLWYNLEGYFVSKYSFYSGRVSVNYLLSSSQLSTLTSFIINNDSWSLTYNCSSFAVGAWNKVVDSYARLSAGVPNSPKALAASIKSKFPGYSTGANVPWNYVVYYANGTGTPIKSTVYK